MMIFDPGFDGGGGFGAGNEGEAGVKYGISASSKGAVRCLIPTASGKIVAAGEDGKLLIFSF